MAETIREGQGRPCARNVQWRAVDERCVGTVWFLEVSSPSRRTTRVRSNNSGTSPRFQKRFQEPGAAHLFDDRGPELWVWVGQHETL
jgi:hypothetical protein